MLIVVFNSVALRVQISGSGPASSFEGRGGTEEEGKFFFYKRVVGFWQQEFS